MEPERQDAVPRVKRHLPAEEGVWVFILGDMMVFSLFFLVFMYYRNQDIPTFVESQATLNLHYGALNTMLLLTSSWFVALALRSVRHNWPTHAARLIALAGACGVGFVIVKFVEYGEKIRAGLVLTTNDFYMYYYVFTGVHFLHLLIGLGVLIFLWFKARAGAPAGGYTQRDIQTFEGGAAYWHMVDLLWIVLFPLIYLVK
ncbi:cytochrome c oxidase subunit 3 family protein [Pseudomaricurvus alkylphenolicus]|nr:cytochrome c oxidase subunit 3 family protein [Pseudomaricurvus alkylphenolicus]